MGMFSWKTQDTDRSIAAAGSKKKTFRVVMSDDKGNTFAEESYEGYGLFGGKDYYELLAEMNGKKDRGDGISIAFGDDPFICPSLSESGEYFNGEEPDNCEFQGYFYD